MLGDRPRHGVPVRADGRRRRVLAGALLVGLPFLYSFASMLIGGVGRDAERVADHLISRAREHAPTEREPVPAGALACGARSG